MRREGTGYSAGMQAISRTACVWLLVTAGCAPAPSAREPEAVTLPPMPPVTPSSVPAEPRSPNPALVADRGCASEPAPVSAGSSTAAFDRAAAQQAISGVQLSCCKHEGAAAAGHVTLTFDLSGNVSSAVLDQGTTIAGTPDGDCVVAQYKAIRVPAFGGTPVRVGKSFTLR